MNKEEKYFKVMASFVKLTGTVYVKAHSEDQARELVDKNLFSWIECEDFDYVGMFHDIYEYDPTPPDDNELVVSDATHL